MSYPYDAQGRARRAWLAQAQRRQWAERSLVDIFDARQPGLRLNRAADAAICLAAVVGLIAIVLEVVVVRGWV